MTTPGGAFNIAAQQSLSPGLIAKYGPAWVLTPEEWLNYLMSTGEVDPNTPPEILQGWVTGEIVGDPSFGRPATGVDPSFGQPPPGITDPGFGRPPRPRTRYEAAPEELEAAFSLASPNQDLYTYVAAHFPSGILPQGFAEQWGLTVPVAPEPTEVEAPKWVGPPTPGFLTELTGLERGQPLEARPTKFASGQLLSRLTPSQLQGVGGYVNWAAGQVSGAPASFEDWLAGSQRLLPTSVPRGTVRWGTSPFSV